VHIPSSDGERAPLKPPSPQRYFLGSGSPSDISRDHPKRTDRVRPSIPLTTTPWRAQFHRAAFASPPPKEDGQSPSLQFHSPRSHGESDSIGPCWRCHHRKRTDRVRPSMFHSPIVWALPRYESVPRSDPYAAAPTLLLMSYDPRVSSTLPGQFFVPRSPVQLHVR
jgi:hypothetical protein